MRTKTNILNLKQKESIVDLYQSGKSAKEIIKTVKTSITSIYRILKIYNIPIRPKIKNLNRKSEYCKIYYRKYKNKILEQKRNYRQTYGKITIDKIYHRRMHDPVIFAKTMISSIKTRSKRKGYEFNLDNYKEQIIKRILNGFCEVTKLPFKYEDDDYCNRAWVPSLDRINSNKGYVYDNIRIVVWLYNRCRVDDQDKNLLIMAKALIENSK